MSVSIRAVCGESYVETLERKLLVAEDELLRLEELIAQRKRHLARQQALFVALRDRIAAWSHLEPLPIIAVLCPVCGDARPVFDPSGPSIRVASRLVPLSTPQGFVVAALVAAGGNYVKSRVIAARMGTTPDNVRNLLVRARRQLAAAGIDPTRAFGRRNCLGLRWTGDLPS